MIERAGESVPAGDELVLRLDRSSCRATLMIRVLERQIWLFKNTYPRGPRRFTAESLRSTP